MQTNSIRADALQRLLRREAAIRSFWSDDPLNVTFRQERRTFSLRDFIAFVEGMPQDQFEACTRGGRNA